MHQQIRSQVKERLAKKFPQFDFEAPAQKKEVKLLVAALIVEWELQQQNKTKPTAAAAATAEGGKKRPASAQQQQQQEVEEDDEQERRRRKKEKKEQAAAVSSAASVSSASSASATTAPTGTAATEDPVWKRLLKLAQAMALTPNILKGLKDDPSKRSDELRLRLKAKGAVFNTVPTMEQIKAAAAEQYVLRLFGATTRLALAVISPFLRPTQATQEGPGGDRQLQHHRGGRPPPGRCCCCGCCCPGPGA